ncbi:hypothetical protein LguiB_011137 [Lonicera macranthoides]
MTTTQILPEINSGTRPHQDGRISGTEIALKMVTGSFYIPKRTNPLRPLGEDAHFISTIPQAIGIADGVGSWSTKGVDAGLYARELMAKSHLAILSQGGPPTNPKHVLTKAFLNTKAKGSSTACIVTLDHDCLHAVNVGDSGFMLIRGGEVVYRSPVQQHYFDCPFQLGSNYMDSPSSGDEMSVSVEPGDVIVAGTDGLFDNVFENEIEKLVNAGLEEGYTPKSLARIIANVALLKSLDPSCSSPFTTAAKKAGHGHKGGGKYDDITVVVAYIVPS